METTPARVGSVFYQTTDPALARAVFCDGLGLEPADAAAASGEPDWLELAGEVPIFVQRVGQLSSEDAAFGVRVPVLAPVAARLRGIAQVTVSAPFEIAPGSWALHVSSPGLQRLLVHE